MTAEEPVWILQSNFALSYETQLGWFDGYRANTCEIFGSQMSASDQNLHENRYIIKTQYNMPKLNISVNNFCLIE